MEDCSGSGGCWKLLLWWWRVDVADIALTLNWIGFERDNVTVTDGCGALVATIG